MYEQLTMLLSEKTGVPYDIFSFEKNTTIKSEGVEFKEYEKQAEQHFYISSFQYYENIREQWKSVILDVPCEILSEFIEILNIVLRKLELSEIDYNGQDTFTVDFGNFNLIHGWQVGKSFRIQFAKVFRGKL